MGSAGWGYRQGSCEGKAMGRAKGSAGHGRAVFSASLVAAWAG